MNASWLILNYCIFIRKLIFKALKTVSRKVKHAFVMRKTTLSNTGQFLTPGLVIFSMLRTFQPPLVPVNDCGEVGKSNFTYL